MGITVNHSVTAQLNHSSTLGDLEELVEAAKGAGLDRSARLSVDVVRGDQRDPGYTQVTVRSVR